MTASFQADRLAAGLLKLGLVPGDRVAIWGPNSSDWYISKLATIRAGLVAVSTPILHLICLRVKTGTRAWSR
jgi:acyl-CoA synthetase (AMP-forming)/AMP-acid ligase II